MCARSPTRVSHTNTLTHAHAQIQHCKLGLDDLVTNACLNHLARGPPTAPFYIAEGGGGIERADVAINGDIAPRPQDPPVRLEKIELFYYVGTTWVLRGCYVLGRGRCGRENALTRHATATNAADARRGAA